MLMNRAKALKILELLEKKYPNANIMLARDKFQLLIATVLSAQTADKQTIKVAKKLFQKYGTPEKLAGASLKKIESTIKEIGLYKIKAKRIKSIAKTINEHYNGKVPASMEELLKLPGVGRKTANIVLGKGFGKQEGIAIDTHAFRISRRLGLSKGKTALAVERDLMELLPKEKWTRFTDMLILHGRSICKAQKPKCEECFLNELCEWKNG
ncbi:MAG: endonuclease III [Candidatus Diapherotrites archaeon]|nr:endonuclease III [Candidatus Diapherotrites archaeon]